VEDNAIIRKATFNPKVRAYIFLVVLFYLVITVIGLVLVPFWLCGLGQWLSAKFFKTLRCELSQKQLKFSKGIMLQIEKTIPLENIQDLSFIGGPILRSFGLTLIKVETAGGGGNHHSNMMSIIGIDNAEEFKALILHQRELVIKQKNQVHTVSALAGETSATEKLLIDIKNELVGIRAALKK
jgi:putative membrane protein